jgi:protein gp37
MSEKTGISWTHHTFNPWWGCVKVSPACTNCYAERDSKRYGFKVWGQDAERRFFGDDHWKEPRRWNEHAKRLGERRRVFCASMADVFEVPTNLELLRRMDAERMRLWRTIEETPWLDWLLLTKRPEQILNRTPRWWHNGFPPNVWPGITAETQNWLEARIEALLGLTSPTVRFLSYEPALGPLNLRRVRMNGDIREVYVDALTGQQTGVGIDPMQLPGKPAINWVIGGGESGHRARPSHPDWYRSARDQCAAAGVPFHFKQWGEWQNGSARHREHVVMLSDGRALSFQEYSETWSQTPGDLNPTTMARVGKKEAGRILDGREWNEFPVVTL